MFIRLLFFIGLAFASKIKNIDMPACRNCIHHVPRLYNFEYSSTLNKCKYFGKKDLLSNEITYDYAELCRSNEDKCGQEGKYFQEDSLVELKVLLFHLKTLSPFLFLIFLNTFSKILYGK